MRLSVPQSVLSEHLQVVAKAVPAKSTIPVLEGILFESDGETMTLTATNLELGIRTSFPAAHKEVGKVILPSKVVEIIRRLPGDSVQLTVQPETFQTEIKSGQSEFQLFGINADEFPVFPEIDREEARFSFRVKAADLRRSLRQTLFAVSHDEGKPAFTGVLFTLSDNSLSLAASDTFRLATTKCRAENTNGSGEFLVPARNLHEIIRIFNEDEETVDIVVAQNQLLLECGEKKLSSRLLDENFPTVERVIPREFCGQATVAVIPFTQAVERASLLSEGVNHVVRLSIGEGVMVVRASSKFGRIQEQIPLNLEGEGLEVSLNSRFILDMLKIHEGETCVIQMSGANKPCVLRDSLYDDYLYLVLPIKI
ncbi:MAG: DNA polymerase III subunit beta [Bacillota bacterium]|nr:DNA polymerase III subunit beta [Bacillota bacterium]MDW7684297.1 DNA polymerase III subunit beta [Bacillota bacterium]